MDPVTHGLVGATSVQLFSDKETFRTASFIGFIAALAPDLDVFLGSASNPLLTLELHRQFSHSFIFIPFGALIVSLILWLFVKKRITFKHTYLFSLLGYSTAGLMDYITSYGVYLFWPFLDERFELNIVSVFDPLLSVGLLITASIALYTKKKVYSYGLAGWLFLYLCFAGIQKSRVEDIAADLLLAENDSNPELIIKPTIGNQILWSVRFVDDREICSSGIRAEFFSTPIIYKGNCATLVDWKSKFKQFNGTVMYKDIERFSELSDGLLVRHPNHPEVLGDARYSMLPTTVSPLWGITIDTTKADQHVIFDTYRDASLEIRTEFLNMILGRVD
ncbi:MAG: metal-dependent hydrolase [Balneola sp.]